MRDRSTVALFAGIEAKILDGSGQLDLPADLDGVDFIYAADHQVPMGAGCYKPLEIRRQIQRGDLTKDAVIFALLEATRGALRRYRRVVLAHLFSVLPKVGIPEEAVPLELLHELARAARDGEAALEIDERWRCPGPRAVRVFHQAGVPIFLSTDSHERDTIGQYSFAREVLREAGV